MSNLNLDFLAGELLKAKQAEEQAKAERIKFEELLLEAVGKKTEGTTSVKTEQYVIKTVGKLTRNVDSTALLEEIDDLPEEVQNAFSWKASVSLTTYRELDENQKVMVDKYVEVKEAKPSVSVTVR